MLDWLLSLPAPYFLLALGVGAFISAMLAILRMRC